MPDAKDVSYMVLKQPIEQQIWKLRTFRNSLNDPELQLWVHWDEDDIEGDCLLTEVFSCHFQCMLRSFYERVYQRFLSMQSIAAAEPQTKKSPWNK